MSMPNFLGLPMEQCRLDDANYVILPVPYEWTTCYVKGTEYGPQAIIEASHQLEDHDDELDLIPLRAGIHTAPSVEVIRDSPERQNQHFHGCYLEYLEQGKVVGMLGGEHSISIGAVQTCLEKFPDLTVLHLDAHADLRDSYLGEKASHATTMRRIRDLTRRTVSVGIRSYSSEEREYIEREKVRIHSAEFIAGHPNWREAVLSELSGDIYVTCDLDVFDPGVLPAVGTPEPGGLDWYQITSLLRAVISKCRLVGFDVVELCPLGTQYVSAFTAAKLVYKIIGYDYARRLKADNSG